MYKIRCQARVARLMRPGPHGGQRKGPKERGPKKEDHIHWWISINDIHWWSINEYHWCIYINDIHWWISINEYQWISSSLKSSSLKKPWKTIKNNEKYTSVTLTNFFEILVGIFGFPWFCSWFVIIFHCFFKELDFKELEIHWYSLLDMHQWIHWWSINEYGPLPLGPSLGPSFGAFFSDPVVDPSKPEDPG